MSTDQSPSPTLPEHSALGASSAHRWMACPGSVTLAHLLAQDEAEAIGADPEWRRDGVQAHECAAYCLNNSLDAWEAPADKFPDLTAEMMDAVQVHLDYVRSIRGYGQRFVEYKLHRPDFHKACFGTVDCAIQDRVRGLHVIDYKHGMGVVVEVKNNPQLMYYAFMVIDQLEDFDDAEPVTLTIVQPRVSWHPDGQVRSWETTVGAIKEWAFQTLRPAMQRTQLDTYLDPGEHCRFCPAKLVCPTFLVIADRARALTLADVKRMTHEQLARCLADVPLIRMAAAALTNEAKYRAIQGEQLPGWKLVKTKADRVWKDAAPVAERFGYQPQKIKSPAQVENEPGGKAFVAEYAFSPDAGYDLAPESDRRKAVTIEKGSVLFQKALDSLKEKL